MDSPPNGRHSAASGPLVSNVAIVVLAVCALVVTGLIVRREFLPEPEPEQRSGSARHPDWRSYTEGGHRRGPASARVVVTTFSDFQCPYCRVLAARIDTLRTEFGSDVAFVHRHLPLRPHPHALDAARASECAGEQGRFWAFHDALFARQDSIGVLGWSDFARSAGVPDVGAFSRCLSDTVEFPSLHRDTLDARRLSLEGTPASLVNDRFIQGALPLAVFRDAIRSALHDAAR